MKRNTLFRRPRQNHCTNCCPLSMQAVGCLDLSAFMFRSCDIEPSGVSDIAPPLYFPVGSSLTFRVTFPPLGLWGRPKGRPESP